MQRAYVFDSIYLMNHRFDLTEGQKIAFSDLSKLVSCRQLDFTFVSSLNVSMRRQILTNVSKTPRWCVEMFNWINKWKSILSTGVFNIMQSIDTRVKMQLDEFSSSICSYRKMKKPQWITFVFIHLNQQRPDVRNWTRCFLFSRREKLNIERIKITINDIYRCLFSLVRRWTEMINKRESILSLLLFVCWSSETDADEKFNRFFFININKSIDWLVSMNNKNDRIKQKIVRVSSSSGRLNDRL